MAPDSPLPHPAWTRDISVEPGADLWVFGYGSLMWNPGFTFVERHAATLPGYHRSFCVSSLRYRGTPERPGLVLGLDRGGSCRGIVFRVAAADVPAALDYLWEREMDSRVYLPRMLRVRLRDGRSAAGLESVNACCFVVDRGHPQYCRGLDESALIRRLAGCRGQRGPNIEYLANTVEHLEELGIRDGSLARLLALVLDRGNRNSDD
ncbi:gamma-glutamyl cyclotransferase [Azospirillum sp. TSH100]|uniref:gamma-glutamylcyclotransferase n=1 Tax=Azospirillum sp. TSH100 TaxID=652764 RepID=UPI000D616C67|nr:gamma-glutamylcyclotransferase [Azospirillum sp. TSH100]PWC86574.1 gamma-glutamyl cyclotransferase [Azospirillum sp. TSH100]QCG88496.1 gamma-glutamylcyclotransferase [Azospirillum sp. TSH100]